MTEFVGTEIAASTIGGRSHRQWSRLVAPLGMAAIFVVLMVGAWARASGNRLGAPLAPVFASWEPVAGVWIAVAALVLTVGVLAAPLLISERVGATGFGFASFGLALAVPLSLAAVRGGPAAWSAVFGTAPEAANEYLPALPAVQHGWGQFLDRFAETALTLPIHPSGHPPGLLLAMDLLGIDSAASLAAFVIVAGALTAPFSYLLGRRLLGERRGRYTALLWCFSPAAGLYVATSADALYAALGTLSAVALLSRPVIARVVGAGALALSSFFAYSLLAVGAWASVLVLRRQGARRALLLAIACAVAVITFYVLLFAATGYDPIGAVRATHSAYTLGIAAARPYAFWLFGSPAAFLLAAGLPVAWFALRALGERRPEAVALAVVIGVAAVIGVTKAETERIWLFLVPLACLAAATRLPAKWLQPALALMAAQALAAQVLLETVW